MWRPPERIRHDAQPGRWPSAVEAAGSALFQPIRVGRQELRQRTWVPAMVPWRATEDGFVNGAVAYAPVTSAETTVSTSGAGSGAIQAVQIYEVSGLGGSQLRNH